MRAKFIYEYLDLKSKMNENLEIDANRHLFDTGYKIFFDIYVDGKQIGKCEAITTFKTDDFNETVYDYRLSKNIDFSFGNSVKKDDFDKYYFIIEILNFEIDESYRGKKYGYKSMELIITYIKEKFPKNKGIYLTVFEANIPAVKIYKKLGFKIVQEKKWSEKGFIMKL